MEESKKVEAEYVSPEIGMKPRFSELSEFVISWASARDIFTGGTFEGQVKKFAEESSETVLAGGKVIAADAACRATTEEASLAEFRDGVGDTLVTIITMCKFLNIDPCDCLQEAYDEIKHRKGTMKDGKFVKEDP